MTTPSTARLIESLDADFRRLRDLADEAGPDGVAAKVPTCPEWTVSDLLDHVAMVYLHKAETMRLGAFPQEWPPQRDPEPPIEFLERAYVALSEAFATRLPAERSTTWYGPDQTVGFWIRRMAQETVIHRVDGELALGADIAPIPDDIAVDGIDELLVVFLAYATEEWAEDFEGVLPSGGETALVRAGGAAWLITLGERVTVTKAADETAADVTLTGDPQAALLWLWRRSDDGTLDEQGDPAVSAKLRDLLRIATQ